MAIVLNYLYVIGCVHIHNLNYLIQTKSIYFKLSGGEFMADTKSAGAVCLLAQIALPCSLFAPSSTG